MPAPIPLGFRGTHGVVRILMWHGYLLGGPGSNVYTRSLARAWQQLGHEVVVFCQDPEPERFDLGGAQVVRPPIGKLLPVFVLDHYRDLQARKLQDMSWDERDHFVQANARALRENLPADLVFANHLLLGGPVAAAVGNVRHAVKAHGSELEFSMRGNEPLCTWARETLADASAIYAGSSHTRRVIEQVVGPGRYLERVRVVAPGVDVHRFVPAQRGRALQALLEQARADGPNPPDAHDERLPDEGNSVRFASFFSDSAAAPTVVYFGKLSREKGVHLLLDALTRWSGSAPRPRSVIVGFGPARAELEQQAAEAGLQTLFTGPLEHRHLAQLLPLADVAVTPSIFPEAFGMVAAEAACCGVPVLVANHSGLADIADGLRQTYPEAYRDLASFTPDDAADLAAKLEAILSLPSTERARIGAAARKAATDRWSWERVAARILSHIDL